MSIDYTAFFGYGCPVKSLGRFDHPDDASDALAKRFVIIPWGSANSGGAGGFLLMLKTTWRSTINDDYALIKPLPFVDAIAGEDLGDALAVLGAEPDGDVGWYIGGHTC